MNERLDRLEKDMGDVMGALGRIELAVVGLNAQMPHLATRADLEKRPARAEMWAIVGVLTTVVLAAAAIGVAVAS